MRITVTTKSNGVSCKFYPVLMRNEYSTFGLYAENDWWQFSTILLPPKYRKETYIFFKPKALNNNYASVAGEMTILLQIRWHGKKIWSNVGNEVIFTLETEIAQNWNSSDGLPIQVASNDFMMLRGDL